MRIISCCAINARSQKHCQKIFHFYVSTLGFHSLTQAMEQSCVIMDVAQTFALNVTLRRFSSADKLVPRISSMHTTLNRIVLIFLNRFFVIGAI